MSDVLEKNICVLNLSIIYWWCEQAHGQRPTCPSSPDERKTGSHVTTAVTNTTNRQETEQSWERNKSITSYLLNSNVRSQTR